MGEMNGGFLRQLVEEVVDVFGSGELEECLAVMVDKLANVLEGVRWIPRHWKHLVSKSPARH